MKVQYSKCAYGPYYKLDLIENGVYIVSFYISIYLQSICCNYYFILNSYAVYL